MTKRKPLGNGLPKTPDKYIDPPPTNQEVDELVALWDLYAPKQYRGLLRAKSKSVLEQTNQQPSGRFVWDDQNKMYIDVKAQRVISRKELHLAFSMFVEAYANR